MKPLVYYCRWQEARLRLRGRDETAVWGHLVFDQDGEEVAQAFRYALLTQELTLIEEENERTIRLDEMGVVVEE